MIFIIFTIPWKSLWPSDEIYFYTNILAVNSYM